MSGDHLHLWQCECGAECREKPTILSDLAGEHLEPGDIVVRVKRSDIDATIVAALFPRNPESVHHESRQRFARQIMKAAERERGLHPCSGDALVPFEAERVDHYTVGGKTHTVYTGEDGVRMVACGIQIIGGDRCRGLRPARGGACNLCDAQHIELAPPRAITPRGAATAGIRDPEGLP